MKNQFGLLSLLCVFSIAPLAATTFESPTDLEIEQVLAEKLERELADREEFENTPLEIEEETPGIELVNQAGLFYNENAPVSTHNGGAWHFATGVSGLGNHVFLEDGSGWMIAPSDAYKTLNWTSGHIIWVTTAPWYSFYGYVLHNHDTKASVYANLKEKPQVCNAYTLYIAEIDVSKGSLVLNDRSTWSYCPCFGNRGVMNWRVGQKVLLGINTSFWTSSRNPDLLISTEPGIDGYISARCLY